MRRIRLVTRIWHIDQQKSAWFESDLCVSCAAYIYIIDNRQFLELLPLILPRTSNTLLLAPLQKGMQMKTRWVERKETNRFLHQTGAAHLSLPPACTDAIIPEEGGIFCSPKVFTLLSVKA